MSESLAQQPIWTPPVIATIVYRVVMIIVSIAFIWKKYRRPARQIDEEQLIGVLLPNHHRPLNRPRSTPHSTTIPASRRRQTHPPTLRKVISAQIEDIIQSALGIDDDDGLDIEVSLSSNHSRPELSRAEGAGSSLDNIGLDIEPGDMGLRHRSADGMAWDKKMSRCKDSKEEA